MICGHVLSISDMDTEAWNSDLRFCSAASAERTPVDHVMKVILGTPRDLTSSPIYDCQLSKRFIRPAERRR